MVDNKGKRRLMIITALLVVGVVGLVYANTGSASYMRTIKEVQDNPSAYVGSSVRVTGKVVKGTITQKGKTYRFDIADKGKKMTLEYSKTMPSTFGPDITVIALGKLASKDELKVSELVTKCPSKYQSKANAEK